MEVVGYVRVSTDEQATDGVSIEMQSNKLKLYCELHGLELVDIFIDAGISAKTLKRPGLKSALDRLKSGAAEGLVVFKLDRLSRSVKDWNQLIDSYFGEKTGNQLLSVSDSIDTRTAAGRLVLNVLMSVAQWEREATGERTKDALRHKIAKGERVGKIRYGYDLADDGVSLVPNRAEQKSIRLICKLRRSGLSLQKIADELNKRQIPTKQGNSRWIHTSVNRIVKRTIAA